MAATGKVRVYDLAKELKLENRKVIEDARRLGADVSVPSNTVPDGVAEKIREMYFPKKEQAVAQRSARLIKHAAPAPAPADDATTPTPSVEAPVAAQAVAPAPAPTSAPTVAPPAVPAKPATVVPPAAAPATRIKTLTPPPVAEAPAPVVDVPEEVVEAAPVEPLEPAPTSTSAEGAKNKVVKLSPPKPAGPAKSTNPGDAPEAAEQAAAPPAEAAPTKKAAPVAPTTNVIRLAPAKPFVPPPPVVVARPGQDAGRPGDRRRGAGGRPDAPAAGGVAGERPRHLTESGRPQLHTYVPPPDGRHKGRNAGRGKDVKQEGNDTRQGRRGFQQAAPPPQQRQIPAELKPLRLMEGTTVREYAEKIDVKPRDIVAELMKKGVMATINQTISHELAIDIAKYYGYDISFGEYEEMIIESEFEITPEAMDDTDMRPPIVTVMGHVDHGKTSLLDAIRSARVADGEAGGITQHIGAYSVMVPNPDNLSDIRRVVFLDTPGHEAFTMMRARGAKVTDIVVIVVAADDGVMPQTIEAIEHSKAAGVPIIVAINKIDKGDANPERVKKELAERGLLWDSWGGDTSMVEVSARQKLNINGLLELIILQADLMDLKANPKRMATGTVLEAKLDRGRGAVATVLVQNGSLKIGEPFIVGNFAGRVRALMNDRGERVEEVGPATPVEVLGLEGVPSAGDPFQVVDDVTKAQQISQFRQTKARATALARSAARGLDQLAMQMETGELKELLVILKTDVQGSVEVLKDTLLKLGNDKVKVRIIRAAVGAITYDDVLLASASNTTSVGAATVIIGFNVRPETRAEDAAKQEGVDIRLHSIIYKVEEEISNAMIGMLDATNKEVILGKAEIREIIKVAKIGNIAGCMVINGLIKRTGQARLIRDNVVVYEGNIGSLRRFKEDSSEVREGYECGITIDRFNDYKLGDHIECFITEKVQPTKL